MKWNSSIKQTESGQILFHYTQLGELKNTITPELSLQPDISDKVKMISVSKEYDTDIITLFHAVGDFNYRNRWIEGIKRVEEIDHFLPRVGMRCRYFTDKEEFVIYSSSYSHSQGKVEFSETDENRNNLTCFILESTGNNKTRLTVNLYFKKNFFTEIIFKLMKKEKLEETYNKSLLNITELLKEIKLPAN
ncbi:MAG: hypothetical protein R6W90_08715 [Ignavibacteriaceae bacterium]